MSSGYCKDCQKRHVACHAHCDTYKKWRAELDKVNDIIRMEKVKDGYIMEAKCASLIRQAMFYKALGCKKPRY